MTKFDFKRWMIKQKHGAKAIHENYNQNEGMGMCEVCGMAPHEGTCGMMDEDVDDGMYDDVNENEEMLNEAPPLFTCVQNGNDPLDCHQFQKCIGNAPDGNTTNYQAGSPTANGDALWLALGQPALNSVTEDNMGTKWIYIGTGDGNFSPSPLPTSHQDACCGQQGCPDPAANNGSANNTCGCDGISGATSTGCCVYAQPGYTNCINCCCKSQYQAKKLPNEPLGGGIDRPASNIAENIKPTIDKISKLITLAEQRGKRRGDREPKPNKPQFDYQPTGNEIPIDPELEPDLTPMGPPVVTGPCAASHYTGGIQTPTGGFDPDSTNLDTATGICPCDPQDINNPWGSTTYLAQYTNPNAQTLDASGIAVGSSDPC